MTDHHETSRRVEVLGEGTQAQRREALVARLKRELQERFNYLPTRPLMWRHAHHEHDKERFRSNCAN